MAPGRCAFRCGVVAGKAGLALTHHVPDDGEVGTENATKWLEDGICAEWNIIPSEVRIAVAEDYGETYGRHHAGSMARYGQRGCTTTENCLLTQDQRKK